MYRIITFAVVPASLTLVALKHSTHSCQFLSFFSLLKLQLLLGGRKRVRGIWGIGYVGRECCHLPLSTRNITMLSLVLLVGGRVALRLVSFCLLSSRLVSFVQWITFLDVLFANNHRRQCSAPCGVCVPVCIENYVARTQSYSHTHTHTHSTTNTHKRHRRSGMSLGCYLIYEVERVKIVHCGKTCSIAYQWAWEKTRRRGTRY